MDGLHDGLPDVRGENALQAFLLAVQLIEYLIRDHEKKGGRVLMQDEDGEDVTELSADFYFGPDRSVGATSRRHARRYASQHIGTSP